MRKLVSTLMAVTLMLVSATACAERITPSKNYVTKKVNVGSFNAISTSSSVDVYNPQNEMFRLLGTKRSFSQNETFFFSHPYPALFRLISHF